MQTGAGRASADLVPLFVVVLTVAGILIAALLGNTPLLLGSVGLCIITLLVLVIQRRTFGGDLSFFLLFPTIISVFQNVYLSLVSHALESTTLQVVIIMNFVYSVGLYGLLIGSKGMPAPQRRLIRRISVGMFVLVGYGVLTVLLFRTDPVAALASARNIVAPFLFVLIGLYAAARLRRYLRYLVGLGAVAVIFGFIELNAPNFWQSLGLPQLWTLKGIDLTFGSDLPRNYYASEQINGEFIRRMAGPFADPVNFGTFLFAVFAAAWFIRSRVVQIAVLVAVVFTVSKGALLGLLTFVAVWTRAYRSRFEFFVAACAVAAGALYFYVFTAENSTGSTQLHVSGFLAAFVELPQHPLGRGLGGTGVLAGLFADEGSESASAIVESGIGMVLGQLGIVGAIVYLVFIITLFRHVLRIEDMRERVLGATLLLAITLNAAFNEVALSPNSCAPYFIIIGLLLGAEMRREPSLFADLQRAKRTPLRQRP